MRAVVLGLLLAVTTLNTYADKYVNGYTRSDGSYVQPYHRSDANQYRYDNYSSQGNSNPYTGQQGYQRNEFSSPPAYNSSYGKTPCYGLYCKKDD